MEKGANHTGPQTAHFVNRFRLETRWQISINLIVSVKERQKVEEEKNILAKHSVNLHY